MAVALAAAVVLAAIVGVVVALGGSGGEHRFTEPPQRCLKAWNDDPAAVRLGRHQYTAHLYANVEVLTLSSDYAEPVSAEEPGAACAVIFAAEGLDPEVSAAASVHVAGIWESLSLYREPEELASLQSEAQGAYNAHLGADGIISSLE
jgi:hypothetical protein